MLPLCTCGRRAGTCRRISGAGKMTRVTSGVSSSRLAVTSNSVLLCCEGNKAGTSGSSLFLVIKTGTGLPGAALCISPRTRIDKRACGFDT